MTRDLRLIVLTALLVISIVPTGAQSVRTSAADPSLGIDVTGMDRTARPQDDFFRFVNGTWAARTPIPADLSALGTFAILREQALEDVNQILRQADAGSRATGTIEQKAGDFYRSFMDTARIESLGAQPLAAQLSTIAAIASTRDLATAFASAAAIGVRVPVAVTVAQDPKQSSVNGVLIAQSGLGMPDRDYYLRSDDKFVAIRKAYVAYIARLFTLADQRDPQGAAERVLALETRLAERQWDRARSRDREATYNKMSVAALQSAMPHYDWEAYFSRVGGGVRDKVTDVVVRQPDYLEALDATLTDTPVSTWKEYLTSGLISSYASQLSTPFTAAQFDFSGRVIAGREENRPRWKLAVAEVEDALGEPVGRLYIEKHFKPEAKARMDELVRNLLAAFKIGIDELAWMSPQTRAQAQAKLAKYNVKIGYPDRWRDFSALQVKGNDLVGNVMRSRQFRNADMWQRLGKPVERWRWGFTPQTVNASYNASNNEITFPAGILQPPFFNISADDAVNYGAIGAVIGHEISHGFDDQGRKSDGDGNLRDWWTPNDAKAFEERAAKLGAQYESYAPLPGLKINGRQTMGENIGDLSGLAVAYRAYKLSLHGKEAPIIGGFTGDQRFFMGFAQIWRFKERDEALRNQLLTDAHSPGMYRAFVPLTNLDEFYAAFDVKPGDKLYRAPSDRVKIW